MKILFLHNNFPGQFVHIANALSASDDNQVVFISQYKREGIGSNKIRHLVIPIRKPTSHKSKIENILLDALHAGEDYANCMMKIKREGFYPDIVYDHSGWGCGMYAADIYPDAVRMCYCEWFYGRNADYTFFKPIEKRHPTEFAVGRQRNTIILNNLNSCDFGIAPTIWQYSQFPLEYQNKIKILHDGIDTNYFSPARVEYNEIEGVDLSGATEIVTYATRGLEPYRGFPEFYQSLPEVLEARPNCHVVIVGNDKCHYSAPRKDGKGWGEHMRETVQLDMTRVHFLNFCSYEEYRKILRVSSVHVYLTVPFVLSWSFLEAMSCGCIVVASNTEPVMEVIKDTDSDILCDIKSHKGISHAIISALSKEADAKDKIQSDMREAIVDMYSMDDTVQRHVNYINSLIK